MSDSKSRCAFSQWVVEQFHDEAYPPDGSEATPEVYGAYLCLINGPVQYQNDDQMMAYAKDHPHATLMELRFYWHEITPPGLAPGDDGADLLEDDD